MTEKLTDGQPEPPVSPTEVKSDKKTKPTQAALVILLTKDYDFFNDPSNVAFVTYKVKEHSETHTVRSPEFASWVTGQMFKTHGTAPNKNSLDSAFNVLQARACFSGQTHSVYVRVAQHGSDIYIDLGDADWRVVRVTTDGYTVLNESPVKFRRPKGLLALPEPKPGGKINDLRRFVNLPDDAQWRLYVGFLVGAFRPSGPYLLLGLDGIQGTGKSVLTKVTRALVDPNVSPARSLGGLEDLMLAAHNGWLLAFDNLSKIPKAMSDALCRVSTGGGSAKRRLYENDVETLFEAQRPMVMNGIGTFITESDLLDRTMMLDLPTIPSAQRQDERQVWKSFAAVQPRVFGALLEAVSCAMRCIDSVPERADWPRMMDVAKWVTAAEPQLGWQPGTFMEAYNANREEINARVVEDDKVASAIIKLADNGGWSGTATELLLEITRDESGFPRKPNQLKQRLRELKPNLEAIGVPIDFGREGGDSKKVIRIGKRKVRLAA